MAIQGIIRPPPEIRAVADKTASFVAKNGRGFESRIINSAKGKTPKFAFLHDSSPFHAYYEDRILFYTNGGSDKKEEEKKKDDGKKESDDAGARADVKEGDSAKANVEDGIKKKSGEDIAERNKAIVPAKEAHTARKAKSIVDPVARILLSQRTKIKAFLNADKTEGDANGDGDKSEEKEQAEKISHPVQTFTTLVPPQNISNSQLEVIKLTAQFVVLDGKGGSFLRELTVREWENPTWGFLQPRHGYFAFFTQLVELYRKLLQEAVLIHESETKGKKKVVTLDDTKKMGEENKKADDEEVKDDPIDSGMETKHSSLKELSELKQKVSLDAATEEKGEVRQQIQLINDTAGNIPKCLEYSALHAEFDRYYEEKRNQELERTQGNGGIGGVARVDWHDFVVVETIEFATDEVVEMLPPPPPPPPAPTKTEEVVSKKIATENGGEAMDQSSDEEGGEDIKIVENYAPKVVSSQAKFASEARTHVIDPITKKSIPIADMTEHMRIQLLDPKWAEEKAKFLEKQKDSNLVGGDAIARNMETFAKARTDLFGSSDQGVDSNDQSRAYLEASRIAHAQPQMPQPRPSAQPPGPPPGMNHARPDTTLPDAKRLRVDNMPPQQPVPAISTPVAPIPPPSTSVSMDVPPPISQLENDTETMQTTLSETDFAKSLPDPNVTLQIQIPNDPTYASWNFCGQNMSVTVDVMTKVKAIKQQIRVKLGDMPVNKMQLKSPEIGFLKDSLSLAYLNIGPNNNSLSMVPKVRGGRK